MQLESPPIGRRKFVGQALAGAGKRAIYAFATPGILLAAGFLVVPTDMAAGTGALLELIGDGARNAPLGGFQWCSDNAPGCKPVGATEVGYFLNERVISLLLIWVASVWCLFMLEEVLRHVAVYRRWRTSRRAETLVDGQ